MVAALLFFFGMLETGLRLGQALLPQATLERQWSQGLALLTAGLSLLTAILGGAGILTPLWIRGLSFPMLALLCARPLSPRAFRQVLQPLPGGMRPAVAVLAGVIVAGTLAPNTQWDAHVYHYTLPRLYLEAGRVFWTETGIYDSLFSLMHLFYAWCFGCGGEAAANLTGPLFLWMLYCGLCSGTESRPVSLFVLVFSSPVLLAQAQGGLTELPALAYLATLVAAPSRGWAGLSAVCAALTRLNALPAVVVWVLFVSKAGKWRWVTVALGIGLGVAALHLIPWHLATPASGAWPLFLPLPTDAHQSRAWMQALSPLTLPGLLLAGSDPYRIPLVAGLLLSLAMPLAEPRYALPLVLVALPMAARGWDRLRTSGWLPMAVGGTAIVLACVPVLARCPAIWPPSRREEYLARRVSSYRAFQWLGGTDASRVLLTDPRGYLCPRPFAVIDEQPLAGSGTYADTVGQLVALRCDVVLWDLHFSTVRQSVLAQALRCGDLRAGQVRAGFLSALGPQWMEEQRRSFPGLEQEQFPDPPAHPEVARLRALYNLTRREPVLYDRDGVLVVRFPRAAHSR